MEKFINYYQYSDSMEIESFNPYVIKILISARKKDSISSISKRIGLSYGWAHKWTNELIKEGIFKERYRGMVLQEDNETYRKILNFLRENFNNAAFYYSALKLFGIKYCFTKTDAVYFWTRGGYNIARYKKFYPIFIKIKKTDYPIFLYYCNKLGLKINAKKGIFYSPEVIERFECPYINNTPVDSLNKTIKFMQDNIYNFQPALEMIKEIYGKKIKISYKEVNIMQKWRI